MSLESCWVVETECPWSGDGRRERRVRKALIVVLD